MLERQHLLSAIDSLNIGLLLLAATLVVLRLRQWVLRRGRKRDALKTVVVLGSGGHTAEMITILKSLPLERYSPRTYIVARTDNFSADKARRLEESLPSSSASSPPLYKVVTIHRSREVRQSYFTSVFTTLRALGDAALLILREDPGVVLANGPGTCIPVVFWAAALTLLGLLDCRIVYVESIARVKTLSLTGKLLRALGLADALLVQWEEMAGRHGGTQYAGRIM